MAYTLGNKCAKNLCKRIVLLQLIIENVVTCYFLNTVYIYSTKKTEDTKTLKRQRTKPSMTKVRYSRPTCKLIPLYTIIIVHNTVTQRQLFLQYSPSSRPTSHLIICGQVEVRGEARLPLFTQDTGNTVNLKSNQSEFSQRRYGLHSHYKLSV